MSYLPEFIDIYRHRLFPKNGGGMGFNHSFATFAIARFLSPAYIIESGVFRGHSTWLFEQACPHALIYSLDPAPSQRIYVSKRARYSTADFAAFDWSEIDRNRTLCFFDDHQSAYSRVKDMRWWGFRWAIFEDNYPCGEGDCYSLRHAMAGYGHSHINMSRKFPGNPLKRAMERFDEIALSRSYDRQDVLRRPNRVDAAALALNLAVLQEIPPVVRYAKTIWGTDWEGPYRSKAPLVPDIARCDYASDLLAFEEADPGNMFHYHYICLAGLR